MPGKTKTTFELEDDNGDTLLSCQMDTHEEDSVWDDELEEDIPGIKYRVLEINVEGYATYLKADDVEEFAEYLRTQLDWMRTNEIKNEKPAAKKRGGRR